MTRLGRDLIASLREAIAGDFARVTVSGVTWVRVEEVAAERKACADLVERGFEDARTPTSRHKIAAAIRARGHSKIESFEEEFKEAWKRGKKMP